MSDQPPGQDVLRELVAKWRGEMPDDAGPFEAGKAHALECCADELEAAAAALSGASSPSGAWQPIETAPKDGPVLVANGSVIWIAPHPHISRGQGKCTHWMPLPASPLPSGDSK